MSVVECSNCGRPSSDGRDVCHRCTGSLCADLRKVPALVADMLTTRTRLDRVAPPAQVGKSSDEPLPIRPGAMKAYHDLGNELTTWARAVAADHGVCVNVRLCAALVRQAIVAAEYEVRNQRRKPDGAAFVDATVTSAEIAAIWLAAHHQWLRESPGLAEAFDALTNRIADARRAIDKLPERAYKGTCEFSTEQHGVMRQCGADLYAEKGDAWVKCPKCNSAHEVSKLERSILTRMQDMNYTLGEIRTILDSLDHHVPKSTLYAWTSSKDRKLHPRCWKRPDGRITTYWLHRNDQAMYRLRDVLALAGVQLGQSMQPT